MIRKTVIVFAAATGLSGTAAGAQTPADPFLATSTLAVPGVAAAAGAIGLAVAVGALGGQGRTRAVIATAVLTGVDVTPGTGSR